MLAQTFMTRSESLWSPILLFRFDGALRGHIEHISSLMLPFVSLQLRNIQNMIRVTKENVDTMIAKFAGLEDPPSLYLIVCHADL